MRVARRALASMGYQETIGWSFISRTVAQLFGGGDDRLVLANPIAAELDCMRPSAIPGLIDAAKRNLARGAVDFALFEIGPVFYGDQPQDQRTAVTALISSRPPRRWDGGADQPLFTLKGDLLALLGELGAPTGSLQLIQEASGWWRPGQSARVQLGPKTRLAEFGALHPGVLKAMDVDGALYGLEIILEAVPEPKRKPTKARSVLRASPHMPLSRDFAFLVGKDRAAGELARAAAGADKALIAAVRIFDVYEGKGVPEGDKSVALEVLIQPQEKTLTDAEIEGVCERVVAAVEKSAGAKLRR